MNRKELIKILNENKENCFVSRDEEKAIIEFLTSYETYFSDGIEYLEIKLDDLKRNMNDDFRLFFNSGKIDNLNETIKTLKHINGELEFSINRNSEKIEELIKEKDFFVNEVVEKDKKIREQSNKYRKLETEKMILELKVELSELKKIGYDEKSITFDLLKATIEGLNQQVKEWNDGKTA